MEEKRAPKSKSGKQHHSTSTNQSSTAPKGEEAHKRTRRKDSITHKGGDIASVKPMTTTRSQRPKQQDALCQQQRDNNTRTNDTRGSGFGLPDVLDLPNWSFPRTTQKPIHETAPHQRRIGQHNTTQKEEEEGNSTPHHNDKSRKKNSQKKTKNHEKTKKNKHFVC